MEDNVLIRRVAVESVSEKYQVDSGYDVIGKECLKNNIKVKQITMPEIRRIGQQAFFSCTTLKNAEFFKTWLIRILINECNKIHRQNKKIIYLENYNQTDLVYNDKYDDFGVRQAIKKLDEDLKTMVILYYFEDFNIKEISEIQKLPEGTVKSRLSRARKKLESIFLDENTRKEDLNG